MKLTRTTALAALLLTVPAFALAQATGDQTEAPAEDAAPAAEVAVTDVLATVNGRNITVGDLIIVRQTLPQQYQGMPDNVLTEGLTQQLIDQSLMASAAREEGLDERPDILLLLAAQARAILADKWMASQLETRVTEEAVRNTYEADFVNAEPVVEVRAAHILVDSKEKADDLKAQLDDGADFAELAAEHGTDGTKSRGGDLGYFAHSDMVPKFADAAFAMEPGTVSDPVETQFGWHLIKLEDKRDRAVPPFEAVAADIEASLQQQLSNQILSELREQAEIVRPEPQPPAEAIRRDDLLQP